MSLPRLPQPPSPPRAPKLGPLKAYRERAVPLPPRLSADARPPRAARRWPAPPDDWAASTAEWNLYWAHAPLGRGPEGERWAFQSPMLLASTGFVADFTEFDLGVSIDVQEIQPETRVIQELRVAVMRRQGYTHVFIRADLALDEPISALRDALNGINVGI